MPPLIQEHRPFADVPESSDAWRYDQLTRTAFTRALSGCGSAEERFCRLGGCNLRLRFAGTSLQPFVLPALEHAAIEAPREADLTIDLADGRSSGVHLPFPRGDCFHPAREASWCHDDGRHSCLVRSEDGTLSLVDQAGRRGLFWANDAAQLPWYESGFPLRSIFHRWFRARGLHLVHAAAVAHAGGAVLIVGRGGSGKSTAALACQQAGLQYLGDDYALVSGDSRPCVSSLYCSAKVTPEILSRFPRLTPSVRRSGVAGEKSLLFLPAVAPSEPVPIRAVVWPRFTGETATRLVRASSAALLLALAPSTILQNPGAGEAELRALAQLVRTVPTFQLETGTDLAGLAGVISTLLASHDAFR